MLSIRGRQSMRAIVRHRVELVQLILAQSFGAEAVDAEAKADDYQHRQNSNQERSAEGTRAGLTKQFRS